jgi:hypothetical protein
LLYEDTPQLHGARAYGVLSLTFAGLMLVAMREARLRREAKAAAAAAKNAAVQSKTAVAESAS